MLLIGYYNKTEKTIQKNASDINSKIWICENWIVGNIKYNKPTKR